ncbi:hypothetical protein VDG1235_4813 [Verrucomicrobiia bacterium DG1235]|nr:hypothetical protein VDG1235_4813 [Verrucomicrobiae bacterium DG1235]
MRGLSKQIKPANPSRIMISQSSNPATQETQGPNRQLFSFRIQKHHL